jgi:hypothetical protein
VIEDEIVREVRAAPEAFAASHGYDIGAMVAALRALDGADDRPVARLEPRRPASAAQPASTEPGPRPLGPVSPASGAPPLTETWPVR